MSTRDSWRNVVALVSGAVFSVGLCVSGMTRPAKVLAFLDFFGSWDPSLALVMVGAIAVAALAFRWSAYSTAPVLDATYRIPRRGGRVSPGMLAGAAVFGAGWGLSGYCPGPAVTSLVSGQLGPVVFVGAMLGGMALASLARAADASSNDADDAEGLAPAPRTH